MAKKKVITKKTLQGIGAAIEKAEKNSFTTKEALEYHKDGICKLHHSLNYSIPEIASLLIDNGIPSTVNSLKPLISQILKEYVPSAPGEEKKATENETPIKKKMKTGEPQKNENIKTENIRDEQQDKLTAIKNKEYEKKKPGFNAGIDEEI